MSATNGVTKTLKILMLHGYTQSGPLFNAKTKALEKLLHKAFPGVALSYPTGPLKLRANDVPGFDASRVDDPGDGVECYGWWRRSDTSNPPEYVGIEDGLAMVAETIKSEGPFDGVMGFSQGAAMAAMVTSLLEGESRKDAFKAAQAKSKLTVPYPASFASLDHPPLKFCVSYSGFIAPGERYTGFYNPSIQTPMCHFVGSLDTVVEEARTNLLIDAAGGPQKTTVVVHPGGHFVPNNRQYLDTVVAFIKAKMSGVDGGSKKEERAEDMDMPF
ncbi:Family of serine hydrolases 3 [Neophaeococcomyces mojaviensis]|uniref:Family of serine hydrolases 3 n=1 Tax=Neophaeococcomyces mojaviensis TaxID=3383035 RepID=A0ACC3A6L0_9EURO|nr:Family of serine hydrolases 3 [Knufia sp. JES_112]